MSAPFEYPPSPHLRRHGPRGYTDYDSYRAPFEYPPSPHLRRHGPCGYTDYENLLYACATCNSAKGDRVIPDPLALLTGLAVRVTEDGTIHTDNPEAARLIELLGLDSSESTEFLMLWIGIIALAAHHNQDLYRRLVGYPDDLPDLRRLQPPDGNSRPEGLGQSALAQKEHGTLPASY